MNVGKSFVLTVWSWMMNERVIKFINIPIVAFVMGYVIGIITVWSRENGRV